MAYGGSLNHLTNANYGNAKVDYTKLNQLTYFIDTNFVFRAFSTNISEGAYVNNQPGHYVPNELIGVFLLDARHVRTGYCKMFSTLDEVINYLNTHASELHSVFFGNVSGITEIPDNCFEDIQNLYAIELPSTINSIGKAAFKNCDSLQFVTFKTPIDEIPESCFEGCDNIQGIEFGNTLEKIGKSAFERCTKLEYIKFGDVLTDIGERAFYDCDKLASIDLNMNIRNIGAYAFYDCDSIKTVMLGSIETLGRSTFENCDSLKSIIIPNSVTTIEPSVFKDCVNLSSVVIGTGLTSISDSMFNGCISLHTINIPDTITSIGKYAFANSGLYNITLGPNIEELQPYAFSSCLKLFNVDLSQTRITKIEEGTFTRDVNLNQVIFPDNNHFEEIGYSAFNGSSLTSIEVPYGVMTIDHLAFANMKRLTSATLPETVTNIENDVFYNDTALTDLRGYSTTPNASWSAPNTQCVFIDETPRYDGASIHIINLDTLEVKDYDSFAAVKTALAEEYGNDTSLKIIIGTTFIENNNITKIKGSMLFDVTDVDAVDGDTDMSDIDDDDRKPKITCVEIGEGVTDIANWSFGHCTNLKKVVLPTTLKRIGLAAFSGCTGLSDVNLDELTSLETLYTAAFGNTRIHDITLPDSLSMNSPTVPNAQFIEVKHIDTIKFGNGVKQIPIGVFSAMSLDATEDTIETLNVPSQVTSIGTGAFVNRTTIKTINFGTPFEATKISTIGDNAFKELDNVTLNFYGRTTQFTNEELKLIFGVSDLEEINVTVNYINPDTIDVYRSTTNELLGSYNTYAAVYEALSDLGATDRVTVVIGNGFAAQDTDNETIPSNWMYENNNITSVIIGEGITTIGQSAFHKCANLTSVTLPNSLTTIHQMVFAVSGLTSVTIPDNVVLENTDIAIFASCTNLKTVTFPTKSTFNIVTNSMFASVALVDLTIPGNVQTIDQAGFAGIDTLRTITLNEGLQDIAANAFAGNTGRPFQITSIELPSTVQTIGDNAFKWQTNINSITIHGAEDSISGAPWGATNATVTWVTD